MPIYLVLKSIAAGSTVDDVLDEHPHLTRENVGAAIAYAAALGRKEPDPDDFPPAA